MLHIDPARLARRQIEIDRERTARFPHLLAHKFERMSASPLALLRGSAPLFYELLSAHPSLAEGPPGEGWIVGDAHVENFGAYRPGALSAKGKGDDVVFDLNDFDDALVAPWRFDVMRLATSLILGGREIGADGPHTLALCDALLEGWVGAAFGGGKAPPVPDAVKKLVDKVHRRTRLELLDARTRIVRGHRHLTRGERYEDLPPRLRAKAERAFRKYAARLPKAERPDSHALEIVDAAFRVAGTGSLGCLRVAVLARGKGGRDGEWLFDMKEEGTPSAVEVAREPRVAPGERVCAALRACLARPPRMIGTTKLRGASMFVRRLAPQEDKLDLTALRTEDLVPLGRHLGALLGRAHRRGATRVPKKRWKAKDRARILEHAIALAGVHEAAYLAFCDLVRK